MELKHLVPEGCSEALLCAPSCPLCQRDNSMGPGSRCVSAKCSSCCDLSLSGKTAAGGSGPGMGLGRARGFPPSCLRVGLFSRDVMSHGDDQQPQALAKPTFSDAQASALVESLFGLKVSKIRPLPSYDDQNFHVCISSAKDAADEPTEYVLKISNAESSRSPELIEVQSHVSMFLRAAGFPTASVHPTAGGHLSSLVSVDGSSGVAGYLLRLLSYLPGTPVAEVPSSPQLLYEVGRLAGKLDETLQKFRHPKVSHLRRENFIWNLKNVPLLEKYLDALGQSRKREIVVQVIQLFKDEILPKLCHFRECHVTSRPFMSCGEPSPAPSRQHVQFLFP
ncbi:hydroxylysine kinase isoform X3 [Mustela erminea]|uniref:hydroxylysine kinase isoform X3 n=2 Tax=Mustela erminea TaxID=36723 RepID=UPI0013876458|nr:hydroxylysine kinase isoform X3 [Mustela erminea]